MTQKYTEADTEAFYDHEDSMYRSFWDSEGSLHWGYFENLADARAQDFLPACHRWNEYMLACSGLTTESRVLDIGCGNGNTAIWLAHQTGCEVVGIDISTVRVDNCLGISSGVSLPTPVLSESISILNRVENIFEQDVRRIPPPGYRHATRTFRWGLVHANSNYYKPGTLIV
ncbi:methyltransferase domain-containing protein [Moorena sp. SIO3H5]|uniref:SAM-dependent methyltransferase n=1 Tax=Moorena sp. SIO3H5 TaxID=2607834 RepID=UPI0025FD82B5|nr:methyltransferase domain-containing protein [Moorena sp. SIO3H5]